MCAYALMHHADELDSCYLASPYFEQNNAYIKKLRAAIGPLAFSGYRGIGRYPFTEDYPLAAPGFHENGNSMDRDREEENARLLLMEMLGSDDYTTPYPRAFVASIEQAKKIQAALDAPEKYEIVELCLDPDRPANLLGFDVGYWSGGNFSILCDAAIWPIWHPPDPSAFEELKMFTKKLNSHALFQSWNDAQEYLEWYSQQDWAETEPSEFSIIAVGA